MKLNDLIKALADEIERVLPDLNQSLEALAGLDVDSDGFMDALDQYSSQAQRMGEAAEVAGFPGLQAVCQHVLENTLLLAACEKAERGPVIAFLRKWPALIVHYLQNLSDPSTAAGLLDHLRAAPSPIDEEQALRIMHQLGAMPLQVSAQGSDDEPKRPILATTDDVALQVPDDVDQKLFEGFCQESPDMAQHLVELVRSMAAGQAQAEDITSAKRIVHTLKGTGATVGLRGLASLGHHFEDILEHFESQGTHVAQPVASVLLDAAFCIEQMVGYVTGGDDYPDQAQAVLQNVLDMANRIDRGESVDQPVQRAGTGLAAALQPPSEPQPVEVAGQQPPAQQRKPAAAGAQQTAALRVGMDRIEELFRVSGEVSVHTAAMEARIQQLSDRAKSLLEQNLRVQRRLFELETLVDVRALAMMRGRSTQHASAAFDPLEMDQYSELHSTAHALVEEVADARVLSHRLEEGIAGLSGMQTRQQLLSRDLQHLVITTRMAEVGTLESRLQRNVRSTCQATGKLVMLRLQGTDTLIDSHVLNRLAEPLLHILRNAVDHGIELPLQRRKAGKPDAGTITLSFSRQGQQVVLVCNDDGRGLDLLAIQNRALSRGLITAGQPLSEEDVARLILLPGFSTRDSVSEVSGRGVGLDVVRDWVSAMNGSIRITSQAGQGCTIELRFAASLTTVQALIVEASGQRYALPSVQIEQAVPKLVGRFERMAEQLIYHHNNRAMIALHLARLVGLPVDAGRAPDEFNVVIIQLLDKKYALLVDTLLDSRELLIKDPGRYARHAVGVAGLCILGDGGVAVQIDLPSLLSAMQGGSAQRLAGTAQADLRKPAAQQRALPCVLVIDDALSVRNALQQLLQDAGYRAETARDGLEAVEQLDRVRPDVVLTDLEMPNMNGVELTRHIRNRADAMHDLPIAMITSRSQDKHRQLAQEAGVDVYITKPYSDGDLIQTIRKLLAGRSASAGAAADALAGASAGVLAGTLAGASAERALA